MLERTSEAPTEMMSAKARTAAATNDGGTPTAFAEGDSNLKTPDYHLPFTGPQVEDALWKIIKLDLKDTGGIKVIESTKDTPHNLDLLKEKGNYVIDYVTASTFPDPLKGYSPINVSVYTDPNNNLFQLIEAGGIKYYRLSKDNGTTWSIWYPKATNSPDNIDSSGTLPTTPPVDPVEKLQTDVTNIQTAVGKHTNEITNIKNSITTINGSMLKLGTTAQGTQIINGTFDYG